MEVQQYTDNASAMGTCGQFGVHGQSGWDRGPGFFAWFSSCWGQPRRRLRFAHLSAFITAAPEAGAALARLGSILVGRWVLDRTSAVPGTLPEGSQSPMQEPK